ncbi:MAG TPA: 3-phosphoshikimate 1-carboxyvinyltransferase [Vicinamibacterales bacterium]|nr:3-phosphoshikimate 1-carboxyvinyltransferase [Vicinamibacterales bacterium]
MRESDLIDRILVRPCPRVRGRVRVPGDKSISHRYALLAALADGVSELRGYSPGADCAATLECLRRSGVSMAQTGPGAFRVEGRGLRGLRAAAAPLDAVNSGTSMRLLAGIAAAHPFRTVITGDASLCRRPMRRVAEPLTRMGAQIGSVDGRPPLTIDGADLHAIAHTPEVPSAQVKSAVLLAGLQASGRTSVAEPAPTRDHTERALEAFGAHVERDGLTVAVDGGQRLRGRDLAIPGDLSSAMFWLALAAGHPGSTLTIEAVGLNPSRTHALDVLRRAGVDMDVDVQHDDEQPAEPVGRILVRGAAVHPFEIAPAEVPLLIDEIPALAAMTAMTPGASLTVRGARELRVKESDRIAMLARGFGALGIAVEEFDDGFVLGGGPPRGGEVDAAGDHRLAMAFAIAATAASGPVTIGGAPAVAVSYPGFFEELDRLSRSGDGR